MNNQSIFFIIDGKKLEAQACFLVATLRKFIGWDILVIAYLRQDSGKLSEFTQRVLEAGKVECRPIPMTASEEDEPWTSPYPWGNKILAASDHRDGEVGIFLDTDTILVEPVNFTEILGSQKIAAVTSDYSTHGLTDEGWEHFYGVYDMPVPEERVRLLRGRKLLSPPYFNAGVIVFKEDIDGFSFGQEWLKNAVKFDHEATAPYGRSAIDQITLPITGYKLGHPVKAVSHRYNYNLPGYGFSPELPRSIVHYHKIGVLWDCPHGPLVLNSLRSLIGSADLSDYLDTFLSFIRPGKFKRAMVL